MKKKVMQFGFITVVMLLLLSGCKTVKGGGWIKSLSGEGKATFGIDLTCKNSQHYGGFTYHDHGYKKMANGKEHHLSLVAWVDPNDQLSGVSCDDQFLGEQSLEHHTQYNFIYRARPDKSREQGWGTIDFLDANRTGDPDDNDHLCININTGPYAGYMNCGDLGGGNLTIYDE